MQLRMLLINSYRKSLQERLLRQTDGVLQKNEEGVPQWETHRHHILAQTCGRQRVRLLHTFRSLSRRGSIKPGSISDCSLRQNAS